MTDDHAMPAAENGANDNQRRGKALKLAAVTAIASKLGSVVLQLVAVPVAIGVLGKEQYGVYATVLIFYALLQLAECGLLGSLSRRLTIAAAAHDKDGEHSILYTGVILIALLGTLGITILYGVLSQVSLLTIVGQNFAGYESDIYHSIGFAAVISLLYLITYNFAAARFAYQEAHIYNLWGALGNISGGVLLIVGIHTFPSVPYVIVSVLGAPVISQTCNAIHLLIQRPYLRFSMKRMQGGYFKTLWKEGLSLQIAQNLSVIGHQEGGKIILGHLFGPVAVALFAALMQIRVFLTNLVLVVTMPLWPSITEAKEKGDVAWIRLSRKRASLAVIAFVMCTAAGLTVAGPFAADLWLRGEIAISHVQFAAFALYFGLLMWVHVQFVLLTGSGSIYRPAVLMVGETLLAVSLGYAGAQMGGETGLFIGLAISIACVSAWSFPFLLSRQIKEVEESFAPPVPDERRRVEEHAVLG
ncbi:MAG: lipopolysaccharide biosynthesis protein [Verrucomicrobiae bacterium]|nr:lipopolysaccharide biosynthesis protein [Verrucomicrobiae bacterium]